MHKKLPPVEVAGYVNRRILTVDEVRETIEYRWFSVKNIDHPDEDYLLWDGDSEVDRF